MNVGWCIVRVYLCAILAFKRARQEQNPPTFERTVIGCEVDLWPHGEVWGRLGRVWDGVVDGCDCGVAILCDEPFRLVGRSDKERGKGG